MLSWPVEMIYGLARKISADQIVVLCFSAVLNTVSLSRKKEKSKRKKRKKRKKLKSI